MRPTLAWLGDLRNARLATATATSTGLDSRRCLRWDHKREAAQIVRAAVVLVASKSASPPTNESVDTTRDAA
jgi:hypothetical protein